MTLKEFMNKYYNGHFLTPGFYHKCELGIHLELGRGLYQFDEKWRLNMEMFRKVYREVREIIPMLFEKSDHILVVVNSYPHDTKKVVYPNFFKRYVKDQKLKYSLKYHEFQWQFDEDLILVQQMILRCKLSDLKLEFLLKALIHQDFHSLQPRLRDKNSIFAPDVFLINLRTKGIFHLYDDRGCEIMNTSKELHEELVEHFKDWGATS